MGVRINGVWHEELADPGTGGEDSGAGRNFTSAQQYNNASAQVGSNWGSNLATFANPTAPGASPTSTVQSNDPEVQKLGQQINSLMSAIASGNKEAFDEAVRQFNLSFGLDTQKFSEGVRQFNENLAIAQSGVTGTFQGNPTQQAIAQRATLANQYAQLYGNAPTFDANGQMVFQPGQTLAANQQQYAQQLGAVQAAAALQTNPFRQAQVMGQLGGVLRGTPVAGFQAPGQAQGQTDFSGMGNMQRLIDDIRGGPGAINASSTQGVLNAIPTPNKLDSVNFYRSSPGTQNIVLQGMQEKYGLSPDESLAQIRNTLPQFQSPTTFGGVKR